MTKKLLMDHSDDINQYDLVEIIQVPERLDGVIEIGDIGVVVKKFDDRNFEVECVEQGGSHKWQKSLNVRYIRLRSKDPFSGWAKKALADKSIIQTSIPLGVAVGASFGAVIGVGLGAITKSLNGILIGLAIGLLLGMVTGALTAALTVKTAGTSGGIGVGYFTGMVFGGVFGMLLGALIPDSLRMRAHTEGLPVLDALMMGRFETAVLVSFTLSILAAIVGVWVGGKNLVS